MAMAMNNKIIKICEDEGTQPIVLPVDEADGSLPLSGLKKVVPKAIGLWYYTESDSIRGVKMTNGKFYPPFNGWGNAIYYCATLSETNADDNEADDSEDMGIVSIDNVRIPEKNDDTQSVDQNILRGIKKAVNSSSFTSFADDDKKIPTARRPHRCDICGTCFTQQSHMLRHRRIHTGEKPFACDTCSERFSRSDKLKLHIDRCHMAPIAMLDPPQNESASPIKEKREKKPRILDDAYDWSIRAPSASSSTSPNKTKHLTVRFKKTAKIDLDNGHDGYYSVVNMAEVEMEDDEPVSIVPVALAEIKSEPEESVHLQEPEFIDTSETASDEKPFRCEECCKPFAKKNQLHRHMRIHTGERPFQCEICMKSFTRVDALKRHMASMGHQKQKSDVDVEAVTEILIDTYPDILPNGMEIDPLIDESSDHQEVEIVEEDIDSETHCDVASFAQVTYSNLESANSVKQEPADETTTKTNCKKVSQGKENYCQQCNHAFTNKFNYNLHMESHKKVARTYKCTYCEYVFRRQSHLTRHILIHTGEKPFRCHLCEERFSRSDKLKLHVKRTHPGCFGNSVKPTIEIEHS
ncbi:zinc finger protein ZFP2-like isoform X2 [Planococcus citri]|uniref:zinc finger protein ZFP2-like isoform X2 n=1 Tax=Planococcus citri TaxID=170843 RepID=UPI0031F9EA80